MTRLATSGLGNLACCTAIAKHAAEGAARRFEYYASLADTFPFEEEARPTAGGEFGLLVREPVGVVAQSFPGMRRRS